MPGYTLDHGPWKWKPLDKSSRSKTWAEIADHDSFKEMILHLKAHPNTQGNAPSIVICHVSYLIFIRPLLTLSSLLILEPSISRQKSSARKRLLKESLLGL